jgi:hypothetical protein
VKHILLIIIIMLALVTIANAAVEHTPSAGRKSNTGQNTKSVRVDSDEHQAKATVIELYAAPLLGATSLTNSNGAASRDTKFSYGAEALVFRKQFGLGLNYLSYTASQDGNSTVNVSESDQWVTADLKFRFLTEDLSPYISVGGGTVFETVSTQLMGQAEKATGTDFIGNVGLGLFGRFQQHFGFDISAKYFQFSNVNGFSYCLSLGYYIGSI